MIDHVVVRLWIVVALCGCGHSASTASDASIDVDVGVDASSDAAIPPPTPVPRYAYLPTETGLEVAAIDPASGSLRLLGMARTSASLEAEGHAALSPSGRMLVDASYPSTGIEAFGIDPITGTLTPGPDYVTPYLIGFSFAPHGGFLYAADFANQNIRGYAIDETTATLVPLATAAATHYQPAATAIEPSGHVLYATTSNNNPSIQGFSIADDGSISPIATGFPIDLGAGRSPGRPIPHPAGKLVAVPLGLNYGIAVYTIDAASGALAPVFGSPFSGSAGQGVFTPDGRFLYTTTDSSALGGYRVDVATGALSALPAMPSPGVLHEGSVSIDPTGTFLYVSLGESALDTIVYRIGSDGSLTETSRTAIQTAPIMFGALGLPVSFAPRAAYVVDDGNPGGSLTALSMAADGTLAPIGSPTPVLDGWQATTDARGEVVYVASTSQGIYAFATAADGSVSALPGSPYPLAGASSVALTPNGKQLLAVSPTANTIESYPVTSGGALGDGTLNPMLVPDFPIAIAIHPSGRFLWIANNLADQIAQVAIDEDGNLTWSGAFSTGAGSRPRSIAFSPDGEHAYVTFYNTGMVGSYRSFDGFGNPAASTKIAAGTDPIAVATDGLGRFAYVTDSGAATPGGYHQLLDGFTIDAATVTLTAQTSTYASGPQPFALAADLGGNFVLAACAGVAPTVAGGLSEYAVSPTGALTAVSSVPPVGASPRGIAIVSSWK